MGISKAKTVAGVVRSWRDRRAPVMTDRTNATNTAPVETICELLGDLHPDRLTINRVEAFRNQLLDRGLAKITVARYLSVLRAAGGEIWSHLPIGKLISELKREPNQIECFTKEEARSLVGQARQDEGPLFALFLQFAFATGCRRGEILACELRDVDFDHSRIHIRRALKLDGSTQNGTKWGGQRLVPMGWHLHGELHALVTMAGRSSQGRLFPEIDQNQVGRRFQRIARRSDVRRPLKFHCIRHSAISWALAAGVSLRKASEIFGVSQAVLEAHYAHFVPAEIDMGWSDLFKRGSA